MRAFFAIVVKDLKVRFASPTELLFFIVLPLVFTVVLAGSIGGRREARDPVVLLRDTAGTPASMGFDALLSSMPGIRLRAVTDPTELISSPEPDLLVTVKPEPDAAAGLPFTLSFQLSPWKGSAASTAEKVGAWLKAVQGGAAPAPAAAAPADAAPMPTAAPAADVPTGAATSSAGQVVTWALVPLLGLGAGLLGERRRGTLRRVRATPAPRAIVTAASAAAEALAALVQVALLACFGAVAFGLPWLAHPGALLLLSAAFCAAGAAAGVLLGTLCRTPRQAGSLGLALAMVLAVLGGCWYPASLFPAGLRTVANLDPAGWAMEGYLAVLGPGTAGGSALHAAAHSSLQLAIFAAAALLLAGLLSRRRAAASA